MVFAVPACLQVVLLLLYVLFDLDVLLPTSPMPSVMVSACGVRNESARETSVSGFKKMCYE